MASVTSEEHKRLALQAAKCADMVLALFTQERPDDSRPKAAIEAARNWAAGELSVAEARKECSIPAATAAARCAGHAAATAHVWTHAAVAEAYMKKAMTTKAGS
jgi:hypothetical protein